MSDARGHLASLVRIQDLAMEIQGARAIVDGAPVRIEEAEERFRERNAEYVAQRERYDAIDADRRLRHLELQTFDEARKKFQDSLMQVKNQREYAAVLKEIDAIKARIAEHEDVILLSMDEIETLKSDLEARASHIETERAIVDAERSEVEAAAEAARGRIVAALVARESVEAGLPRDLVANVKRVEEGRRGVFLVRADREMCSACHVRIRPQVYQEIKQASKIHVCGNCKRYLFVESALQPDPPAPAKNDTSGATIPA